MKITTLLHMLEPRHVRRLFFKKTLRSVYTSWFIVAYIGGLMIYCTIMSGYQVAIAILIGLVALMPLVLAYRLTSDSILRKNNPKTFDRTRLIEFDEEGYTIRFDSGSHLYNVWTDVDMATDAEEVTTIHATSMYYHMIPHTAWPTTKERDEFLSFLRTKSLLK